MIGVDYDLPYVNMDNYIDVDEFLSLSKEICVGLSKSEMFYPSPGSRTKGVEGFPDMEMPYEGEQKYKEITKGMNEKEKRLFLKFYKKVFYGTTGVFIKKHNGYHNKHLASHSDYTENAKHFPNFVRYIEDVLPFEQVGRVFVFVQDHFCPLVEHRDSMDDDYKGELTDFLWFTIDNNAMNFWVRDNNNEKHLIKSTCAWFNENDSHGSDPVPSATFCIRIDGVFKEDFKNKVLSEIQ